MPSNITRLSLCLSLLLLLTACQPEQPTETVTFMYFGDPAEQHAFRSVVDGFLSTDPGVQIELIAMPGKEDYMARLVTDFAAGAPPDVFLLNYRRLAQFHNNDVLTPLQDRFQNSTKLHEDDFYPIALDAFRDNSGALSCIPQNISSQVIYYNKDIFDLAGYPYPNENWTWTDFRAAAIALTQPDTNGDGEPDQYGLGLEPKLMRMASFIWQNGGNLVDDAAAPSHFTLNTPAAEEAIQFVTNLAVIDAVVPNKTAELLQQHPDRFLLGNIAMYVNSRRFTPIMRQVADFDWDVAPLPQGKTRASVLHSDGYCMAANAPEAAWQFIEYAVSEEGQRIAARLGRTVPSLRHVAESDAFLDSTQPPANAQVWLEAEPYLRLLPRLAAWREIERVGDTQFELIYLKERSLEAGLDFLQETAMRDLTPLK